MLKNKFISKDKYMSNQCVICEVETEKIIPKTIVLKLRSKNTKKVHWDVNVIDNEFLNKKKSKCCCVYCKKNP